tara:strand:- start:383 stop:586 length:204 start_codon:yes stop_codon:yes gene_type:complete
VHGPALSGFALGRLTRKQRKKDKTMTKLEIKEAIAKLETQADAQAPYFDDRLLQRIEKFKALLAESI